MLRYRKGAPSLLGDLTRSFFFTHTHTHTMPYTEHNAQVRGCTRPDVAWHTYKVLYPLFIRFIVALHCPRRGGDNGGHERSLSGTVISLHIALRECRALRLTAVLHESDHHHAKTLRTRAAKPPSPREETSIGQRGQAPIQGYMCHVR